MLTNSHLSSRLAALDTAPSPQPAPLHPYYKALCRQVMRQRSPRLKGGQAIGVTSCQRGTGVSTVVANLGVCAAQDLQEPVVLVDAQLARPALRRAFGLADPRGLVDLMRNGDDPFDYVQPASIANLNILAAGLPREFPFGSFSPGRFSQVLEALRAKYSLLLIDLPEVNDSTCCTAVASLLDGILFVVEAARTPLDEARRATQRLSQFGASVLGVVLNKQTV